MTQPGTNLLRVCRAICAFAVLGVSAWGQDVATPAATKPPVVESAPASPMAPPAAAPVADAATESSPTTPTAHGVYLKPHTEIDVHLQRSIDSAHVKNGDMLTATLTSALRASDGTSLPAGTKVGVTVLAVASAGKISSRGEITLQVTHVGAVAVISDVLTFHGQPGHKDLPDSAPAKGTEASVAAGTVLKFQVPAPSK